MPSFRRQARLLIMTSLTLSFFVVEIVVGYLSGSLALVADSFHMLSDVLAMIIALGAIRLAKKKTATKTNSYGWQRAETLGALINGVFLLALCFTIIIESIQRFFKTEEIKDPQLILIVGGVGLVVNLLGLLIFAGSGHGHSHSHGGGGHGQQSPTGGHGHSHKGEDHGHSHKGEDHGHSHKGEDHGHSHKGEDHGHSHKGEDHGHSHSHGNKIRETPLAEAPIIALPREEAGEGKRIYQLQLGKIYQAKRDVSSKPGYLTLEKGDRVLVQENIKNNLYIGELNGLQGKFSSKNVKIPTGEKESIPVEETAEVAPLDVPSSLAPFELEEGLPNQKQENQNGSHNMRGVFLHILGDALGSVGVIITSLVIWLTDASWRFYLDPIVSLLITAMILYGTIPLVKETSLILLQGVSNFDFRGFRRALKEIPGVKGVHEVHVWRLADNKLVGSVHLMVEGFQIGVSVVPRAKEIFHEYGIHASTIQTEYMKPSSPSGSGTEVEDTSETACLLTCGKNCDEKGCCQEGQPEFE